MHTQTSINHEIRAVGAGACASMGGATFRSQGEDKCSGGFELPVPCWLAYGRNHDVNDAEAEDLVVKLDIDVEIGPQLTLPTKSLETCRRGCTLQRMAGIWKIGSYVAGPAVEIFQCVPVVTRCAQTRTLVENSIAKTCLK